VDCGEAVTELVARLKTADVGGAVGYSVRLELEQ